MLNDLLKLVHSIISTICRKLEGWILHEAGVSLITLKFSAVWDAWLHSYIIFFLPLSLSPSLSSGIISALVLLWVDGLALLGCFSKVSFPVMENFSKVGWKCCNAAATSKNTTSTNSDSMSLTQTLFGFCSFFGFWPNFPRSAHNNRG